MVINKLLAFICILILCIPGLSAQLIRTTDQYKQEENFNNFDFCDNHTIEGVPYVSQETNFYCAYAAVTMLIKYHGINTSLKEVLFNSGVGYSMVYDNIYRGFAPGWLISQGSNDKDFIASLYGLSFKDWTPIIENKSDEECWQEYWQILKQKVLENIPIITSVDPYSIPYLKEKFNITDNQTHYAHSLVILGFNETNNTICYNDPAAGLFHDNTNGTYVYISKEIFKEALMNTIATKYYVSGMINLTDSPALPIEERFQEAHDRNILKMSGKKEFYSDLNLPILTAYGINSMKKFRGQLRIGIYHRMITVYIYGLYTLGDISTSFFTVAIEKENISQHLFYLAENIGNKNLSDICRHDATLLKKEADCWINMTNNAISLNQIVKNNRFIKALFLSITYTKEMRKTLNKMISLEKSIIKGPIDSLSKV